MAIGTTVLTWERYESPAERWCLVPNESDFRKRITQPYRTACGEIIDGHRYPSGRATVDVRSWSCDCRGVDRRPHLHADPWPSRSVVGRVPLCLERVRRGRAPRRRRADEPVKDSKALYEPDRPGAPAHSEVHTVHETPPAEKAVLYLADGTPLMRAAPQIGFRK